MYPCTYIAKAMLPGVHNKGILGCLCVCVCLIGDKTEPQYMHTINTIFGILGCFDYSVSYCIIFV